MEIGVTPQDYEVYLNYLNSKQNTPQSGVAPPVQGFERGGLVSLINPFYTYMMGLKNFEEVDAAPLMENGVPPAPGRAPDPLQPQGLGSLVPRPPGKPILPRKYARGGLVDVKDIESYIRQAAIQRGIDPDIAVRVAKSEGLAPNTWQSNYKKGGIREPSFGPYQLLVGGEGTGFPKGMGNDFMAQTGLDPRDPSTVKSQIDFALNNAAKGGWSPWYGAEKAGISRWAGIKNATTQPVSAATQHAATNMAAAAPGTVAKGPDGSNYQFAETAGMAGATGAQGWIPTNMESQPSSSGLGGLMGLMMMAQMNQPPPAPAPTGGAPAPRRAPVDPERETERTSQTPDVYMEDEEDKRRRRTRYAHT